MEKLDAQKLKVGLDAALTAKKSGSTAETLSISAERNPVAGIKLREKNLKERIRHEAISRIAQDIYERRTDSNNNPATKEYKGLRLYKDEIDKMLRVAGFNPGKEYTDKEREALEKWDWKQAAAIYEEELRRGDKEPRPETRPVPKPRPAEAAPKLKPEEKFKPTKRELTGEQKKLFESLVSKARLEEIEGKFPQNMEGLDEEERGRWERRRKALFSARRSLEYMAGNIPEKEVVNFRDKIMNQFLAEYRRLRREEEKTFGKSLAEEADVLQKFKKDIRERMKEALSDRFSEKSVSLIMNYYTKIFDLEYLLGNSK